jgi:hypothetical protein
MTDKLIETNQELGTLNRINCYFSLSLIVFGCIGNLISFQVFVNAKNKLPKLSGSSYMIALTLSNTIYLLAHFYVSVVNQLVLEAGVQDNPLHFLSKLSAFDTNVHVCRFVGFCKHILLLFNTLIVLAFSVKRFIAVYFPLRVLTFKLPGFFVLQLLLFVSFLSSIYIPVFTGLQPAITGLPKNVHLRAEIIRLNFTANFNKLALRPTYNDQFCGFSDEYIQTLLRFHAINMLVLIISYLVISVSIILIVVKLRSKRHKFQTVRFVFNKRANQSECSGRQTTEENEGRDSNKSSIVAMQNLPATSRSILMLPGTKHAELSSFNPERRRGAEASLTNVGRVTNTLRSKAKNNRIFRNSKMLTGIAVCFVLLNFPYFMIMGASVFFIVPSVPSDDLAELDEFKIKVALVISEILHVSNFCITSLVFLVSGRIFRIHLFRIYKIF